MDWSRNRSSSNPASSGILFFLLQPADVCTSWFHEYCPPTLIVRSALYVLPNSALSVAVKSLVGIAVVRRVPDAVEHGAGDLRSDGEDSAADGLVGDVAGRVEAAGVVRLAPARRGVHGEPLPLLEGKPDLRREVETRQA